MFTYYEIGSTQEKLYGGVWGVAANAVLFFSFYFLCVWVPIRVVAWIASGFISDRNRKPN